VAPIFFPLAPHGWRGQVLDLEPVLRAPRAIQRAEPLRYDALAAKLAGMCKNDLAVALVMLVDHDARTRAAH